MISEISVISVWHVVSVRVHRAELTIVSIYNVVLRNITIRQITGLAR